MYNQYLMAFFNQIHDSLCGCLLQLPSVLSGCCQRHYRQRAITILLLNFFVIKSPLIKFLGNVKKDRFCDLLWFIGNSENDCLYLNTTWISTDLYYSERILSSTCLKFLKDTWDL